MAVVAYLRVSTEKQFLENQREEIIRFAEKNGLSIDRWYMPRDEPAHQLGGAGA